MNMLTLFFIIAASLFGLVGLKRVAQRHTAGFFDDIHYRRALWKRRREANRRRAA